MKKKAREELHAKSTDELKKQLVQAREALFQQTMDHKMNSLKNTKSLSRNRDEIAVIQTIIRTKESLRTVNENQQAEKGK